MDSKASEVPGRPLQRGLGLLEWIILFAFLACMVALAIPTVHRELDSVKQRTAATDVQTISNAADLYLRDGEGVRETPSACVAIGPGEPPTGISTDVPRARLTDWLIGTMRPKVETPYMARLPVDPWDHAYVVRYTPIKNGVICWVISAGPDGIVQTEAHADAPQGDDLAVRLR